MRGISRLVSISGASTVFLAAVTLVTISVFTGPAFAQDPYYMGSIGLYADTLSSGWCGTGEQYAVIDMYVIVKPDVDGVNACQFRIEYPAEVPGTLLEYNDAVVRLINGSPAYGIFLAYYECQRDWHWVIRETIVILDTAPTAVKLDSAPGASGLEVVTCLDPSTVKKYYRHTDFYVNQCGYVVWPAYVDLVYVTAPDAVTVYFADEVSPAQAEDTNDYRIYNSDFTEETIEVTSAVLQPGGMSVVISMASEFSAGIVYILEIRDDSDTTEGANVFSVPIGLCADLEFISIDFPTITGQDASRLPVSCTIRNKQGYAADSFLVGLEVRFSGADFRTVRQNYEIAAVELSPGAYRTDTFCVDLAGIDYQAVYFSGYVVYRGTGTECRDDNNTLETTTDMLTPRLRYVRDVEGDGGRWVTLGISRSPNGGTDGTVRQYELYMRNASTGTEGCGCTPGPCGTWDLVQIIPSTGSLFYIVSVNTPCDLVPGDDSCVFDFKVSAVEVPSPGDTIRHWSQVRTAYSIDHTIPARPTGFTAFRQVDDMFLSWNGNPEADLSGYRLYRSPHLFGGWSLLQETAELYFLDTGWFESSGFSYRLTARDLTGNESFSMLVSPDGFAAKLLADFQAGFEESGVRIEWSMLETADNLFFHISRSAGGGPFEQVSSVEIERGRPDYLFVDDAVDPFHRYRYRLEFEYEGVRYFLTETEEIDAAAPRAALAQNVPNPFNPVTRISFFIPGETDVRINIFDVSGRRVRELVSKRMTAGTHTVEWDGLDSSGGTSASGVYFYRFSAGSTTISKKMILLR